jgi:hypothetical protein
MRIGLLVACASITGACTNSQDLDARSGAIESKVNQALRDSAAVMVDATTALDVALTGQ